MIYMHIVVIALFSLILSAQLRSRSKSKNIMARAKDGIMKEENSDMKSIKRNFLDYERNADLLVEKNINIFSIVILLIIWVTRFIDLF